jgi:anti-sigma B factor antagonist
LKSFQATSRLAGGVTVVEISGHILLGEGTARLRPLIRERLGNGYRHILLNLAGVHYMDSSGIGALVSGLAAVRSHGGELKLLHPNRRIHDLLQLTRPYTVFDVHTDEAAALCSFH